MKLVLNCGQLNLFCIFFRVTNYDSDVYFIFECSLVLFLVLICWSTTLFLDVVGFRWLAVGKRPWVETHFHAWELAFFCGLKLCYPKSLLVVVKQRFSRFFRVVAEVYISCFWFLHVEFAQGSCSILCWYGYCFKWVYLKMGIAQKVQLLSIIYIIKKTWLTRFSGTLLSEKPR